MDRLTRIIEDGPIKVLTVCQARQGDATVWKEWSVSRDSKIEEALYRLAELEDVEDQRNKGCKWCEGFCPDVTGDPHADYNFCPMCGRALKGGE